MGIAFLVGFIGFFVVTRAAMRLRWALAGGPALAPSRRWRRLERHAAMQQELPPPRPSSSLATPEAMYRVVLDLDLPRRTEDALETILDELWAREPRLGVALGAVADEIARDTLDREAVAAALARAGAGASIVDGIERIHALLSPEERARLRGSLSADPSA